MRFVSLMLVVLRILSMKKFALFLILYLFGSLCYAGTCRGGFCYDCYDSYQGLPQNRIAAFALDHDGYMFVAGRNFLARFDGHRFVLPDSGRLAGMSTSMINDLTVDDDGNAYLSTDLGLWTIRLGEFESAEFINIGKIGNFNIKSLTYDRKRKLVFGTAESKGVFAVAANGFVDWLTPENSRLATKNAEKIFAAGNGTVWLGTDSGVYFLKDGFGKFVQVDYLEDSVTAFAEGTGNTVFAGGKNGLYVIENGSVTASYTGESIPFSDITALENDDSGMLWIGTAGSGIFLFDGNNFSQAGGETGTAAGITAFARDKEGEIWFGTSTDGFCIAKKSAFFNTLLDNETVDNVVADSRGNILVSTRNSGIIRLEADGAMDIIAGSERFNRIFVDSDDILWASSVSSGLYLMQSDRTFKPVKEIYVSEDDLFPVSSDVFFCDSDGNVWVNDVSLPDTLFVFRNDKTVERFMLPYANAGIVDIIEHAGKLFAVTKRSGVFEIGTSGTIEPIALWNNDIFVKRIFVDSKQRIWIITLSDEIFIDIDRDAVAFPVVGIGGKAVIHSVSEDKNGNLWLATNIGVALIQGRKADCFVNGSCADVPVRIFGKKDGMGSWECAEGQASDAALSAEGILFMPMTRGIALFDTGFSEKRGFVPEIRIDGISFDGNSYSSDKAGKVILPHSGKNLKISYSAPLFSVADGLLFDYIFDDVHAWGTTERSVVFPYVQSGIHEFSVRVYRSDDLLEFVEKKLIFQVNPAFYEKKGFIVSVPFIGVILCVIIIFLNRRLKAIRDAETNRFIEEKTAELQIKKNALKEAVMKDPLTGLMNRRFMFEVEERKIRRFIDSRDRKSHLMDNRMSEKNDFVYGIVMMDIDHFKRVNDLYGHDAGDTVLKGIAEIMQDSVRADDILIRWGGEEFLIVLKNIPLGKIIEIAKKIRKAIEMHPFELKSNNSTVWVTASMGVVYLPFFNFEPKCLTFENIVTLADLALYNSKENGRDMATFVVPGKNSPKTPEELHGMLGSSEFAAVNGFYTFEKIEPDNFSEFEI